MQVVKAILLIVLSQNIQLSQSFLLFPSPTQLSGNQRRSSSINQRRSSSINYQARGDGPFKSNVKHTSSSRRGGDRNKGSQSPKGGKRRSPTKVEAAYRRDKEKRQRDKLKRLFTKLSEKDAHGGKITRKLYMSSCGTLSQSHHVIYLFLFFHL